MYPDEYNYHTRDGGFGPDEVGGGPWPGVSPNGGAPAPPVAPSSGSGTGTGGWGGGSGSSTTRPMFNFKDAPVFHAPNFHAPTFAEAQQEPGYQFRLQGGSDALERSAAAKGVLRTGGTLKDITEYGQNFASQEYGNVFNRALEGFDRLYRGAHDEFTPRFAEWQFLSSAEQQAAMAQWAYSHQNHGGGGGANFATDSANAPPPVPPPPFEWKNGNQDPALVDWLRTHPNPHGGNWPGRDY